jgi:uncharacterized RDD family membrane protein YckC
MTRSTGGSRQPNRPYRDEEGRQDASDDDLDYENNGNKGSVSRSRSSRRTAASVPDTSSETVDIKRRGIALMADVILIFAAGLLFSPLLVVLNMIIPTQFLTQTMIFMAIYVVRDYFYQGKGIGKNLMGLQVVDVTTGLPPSLAQSFKRNILFSVPIIVMGLVSLLKYLPIDKTFIAPVQWIVGFACNAYVVILLPAECWFATRDGGRRIGDKFANTHVINSDMDFSKPI